MTQYRTLTLACVAAMLAPIGARAQSSPSDFTSATRYDQNRRVTGTISPDPDGGGPLHYAAVRNTYDNAGRLIRVEKGELSVWQSENIAPSAWTGFTIAAKVETNYDSMNRKLVETNWGWDNAAGVWTATGVNQYSYDSNGRLECAARRMNPAAWSALPSSACTPGSSGAYGPDRISRSVYDAAGQLLKVQKAYGTPLQQDYVTYTYTANGKQARVIDANGNVAGYTYDGFDRLATWSFPSTTAPGSINAADYESYGYDANDNRVSLRKRDGRTFTYTYDSLNRLASKIVPGACVAGYACTTPPPSAIRNVYYGYDLRGLQLYARFDSATGSDTVNDSYDGFGRPVGETVTMGGVSRTIGYQYDADGNRARITYPDTTYVAYTFDGLDRMTNVSLNGSTALASMAYDTQARPSSETRNNVTTNFGYDPVSRLSSLADDLPGTAGDVTTTYAYNPASQLIVRTRSNPNYAFTSYVTLSRNYVANGLNQYATAGSAAFGYDSNGNLSSDGASNFTYDAENRLVAAAGGVNLIYDPMGRLYSVTSSGGVESYSYAGDQRVGEYDASGAMIARYVPGAGEDNPLIWYSGATTTSPRALQGDAQGSIVSVVDASGAVLAYNSYDEYGIPGAGNLGRYQYTGQVWMPQLGMYYYKARIYSPTLGRFLQTDPIGYKDQVDLYAYVSNDPLNNADPSGLGPYEAAWWAYAHNGSYDYQKSKPDSRVGGFWANAPFIGNGGVGAPKCNFFVYDALRKGGVPQTTVNGERRIALAGDWGNRANKIGNYRALGPNEAPQVGDVVSNGGHVGIVVGLPFAGRNVPPPYPGAERVRPDLPLVASAADNHHGNKVTLTNFGFRDDDNPNHETDKIVIWRYEKPSKD